MKIHFKRLLKALTLSGVLLAGACTFIGEPSTPFASSEILPSSTPVISHLTSTSLPTKDITATPGWPILLAAQQLDLDLHEEGSTYAIVTSLLADDLGCRLPCWWGIIPGQTSQEEAQQIMKLLDLKTFPAGEIINTSNDGILLSDSFRGKDGLRLFVQTEELSESYGVMWSDGQVIYIGISSVAGHERWENYYLTHLTQQGVRIGVN